MNNSRQMKCPQCGDQLDTNLDEAACFNCNPNAARRVRNNNKWDSSSDSFTNLSAQSLGFLTYCVTAVIGLAVIAVVNAYVPPGLKTVVFIIVGVAFLAICYAIKDALGVKNTEE